MFQQENNKWGFKEAVVKKDIPLEKEGRRPGTSYRLDKDLPSGILFQGSLTPGQFLEEVVEGGG